MREIKNTATIKWHSAPTITMAKTIKNKIKNFKKKGALKSW